MYLHCMARVLWRAWQGVWALHGAGAAHSPSKCDSGSLLCILPGVASKPRPTSAPLAFCQLQVLKFAINQARPSERKADPGMPSAHANSLAFLVRIQLGGWGDGFWCSLWPIPALHRHSA